MKLCLMCPNCCKKDNVQRPLIVTTVGGYFHNLKCEHCDYEFINNVDHGHRCPQGLNTSCQKEK